MPDNDPTDHPKYFERLDWSIKGRSRTQLATSKLFQLFKRYPQLEQQASREAFLLLDVSFSLWRAVFLYDRTADKATREKHAQIFLRAMLEDNTITFARDKEAREWTFNYYIKSALYRLQDLSGVWDEVSKLPLEPPPGKRSSRKRWDHLQKAFEVAVNRLEREAKNSN